MSKKKNAEIKDFRGWMRWAGSGQEAFRWMEENRDTWMLLWLTFAYGDEKALKRFEIYSNATNKSEHFTHMYNDFCQVVDTMGELLGKEEAKLGRNQGESGSNGKNPEMMSVDVRNPGER